MDSAIITTREYQIEKLQPGILDSFNEARSTGNYATLKAISTDPMVKSILIKLYSPDQAKLVKLVDLFYDLLELFGYERGHSLIQEQRHWAAYDKLVWSLTCYVWTFGADSWVELFKWKTSAFFASVFNACNIPRRPRECEVYDNPYKLFFGRAQRFLHNMNRSMQKDFANSVLMLKKGAPAVSTDMVLKKRIEVYKQLTTPPNWTTSKKENINDPVIKYIVPPQSNFYMDIQIQSGIPISFKREVHYNEDRLKHFITKTCEEVFGDKELSFDEITGYAFPSISANYNWSRKNGGGLGEISGRISEIKNKILEDFLSPNNFHGFNLFSPTINWAVSADLLISDSDFKQKSCHFGDRESFYFEIDDKHLREVYIDVWTILLKLSEDETPFTATVGLPEPLKVRVITKGPPITYFILKRVQKFLWRTLKNHPIFRLIGEPLTEEIVNEKFKEFEWILSGDYKASTDNIYSWISNFTCKEVFKNLRMNSKPYDQNLLDRIEKLTKRGLTGHIIENPEWQAFADQNIDELMYNKMSNWANRNGWDLGNLLCNIPRCTFRQVFSGDAIKGKDKDFLIYFISEFYQHLLEESGLEQYKEQEQGQLMGSVVSFPFLCLINCAVCWYSLSCDCPVLEYSSLKDLPLLINGDDCVFSGTRRLEGHWLKCIKYVGFESSVGKTYFSQDLLVMNSQTYYKAKEADSFKWTLKKYINFGLLHAVNKAGEEQKNIFALASIQRDLQQKTPLEFLSKVNKMFFRNHMNRLRDTKLPFYMPQWSGGLGLIPECGHSTRQDRKILTSRIISGEKFQSPPKFDKWRLDQHIRKLLGNVLAVAETFNPLMVVNGKITDLEDKEFYNPFLALTLLCSDISEYEDDTQNEEEVLNAYIRRMKKQWNCAVKEDVKPRSLEKLTERYELKKHLALLMKKGA